MVVAAEAARSMSEVKAAGFIRVQKRETPREESLNLARRMIEAAAKRKIKGRP
jgi:hypothetical protein